MSKKILVFSTAPDPETAATIARALVEERLAACVNLLSAATSIYRWQGAVETATETVMLMKTTEDRLGELRDRTMALHPYEVPEFIAVEIVAGHPAYLEWIGESTAAL
jgi:periplasmic divalent cation tolerance protein